MKQLVIDKLPVGVYFWRRGYSERFYKLSNTEMVSFNHPTEIKPILSPAEIVLSDPNWCSNCWHELEWDNLNKCSSCGAVNLDHQTMDEIRRTLVEWSGNPNVHL